MKELMVDGTYINVKSNCFTLKRWIWITRIPIIMGMILVGIEIVAVIITGHLI